MLSGEATVIEEDDPHLLQAGDAACWPAGTASAHQVVNRSGALCSYLILGSGVVPDVVHYPDRGEILYDFFGGTWMAAAAHRRDPDQGRKGTLIEGVR